MLEALQRFPPLVWGCIALATSLIWIAEAYIIDLGRAARMVVSGGPCRRFSAAHTNDLYSLSKGKICQPPLILHQTYSK